MSSLFRDEAHQPLCFLPFPSEEHPPIFDERGFPVTTDRLPGRDAPFFRQQFVARVPGTGDYYGRFCRGFTTLRTRTNPSRAHGDATRPPTVGKATPPRPQKKSRGSKGVVKQHPTMFGASNMNQAPP
jgi:hypothetical protein